MKGIKRVGVGLLPSKSWQMNAAWVPAATIAAGLDAWMRLLLLHDEPELVVAEPQTIRMKLHHLPARLTAHARSRTVHPDLTWPDLAQGRQRWPPPGSEPTSFRPAPDGRPPQRRHQTGAHRTHSDPRNPTPPQRQGRPGPAVSVLRPASLLSMVNRGYGRTLLAPDRMQFSTLVRRGSIPVQADHEDSKLPVAFCLWCAPLP